MDCGLVACMQVKTLKEFFLLLSLFSQHVLCKENTLISKHLLLGKGFMRCGSSSFDTFRLTAFNICAFGSTAFADNCHSCTFLIIWACWQDIKQAYRHVRRNDLNLAPRWRPCLHACGNVIDLFILWQEFKASARFVAITRIQGETYRAIVGWRWGEGGFFATGPRFPSKPSKKRW